MNDRGGVGSQGSPVGGVDRVHAARGVAWGGVESAAGALTGLVVTPLIVRAFGLEGLGLWAASWSLAHSAGLFDLGIGASYARFTASAIARHDVRWGALQIVDRPRDLLRLLREDEHLLAFSSGQELRDCVERARGDPSLRRAVAARGREEVLARHTYEHRARCLTDPRCGGIEIPEKPGALVGTAGGAST